MYRIKAPKNGAWVPILANPDVVLEYNQNVVTTLHEKNLLLLGEDRFLSTLMLRTFPHRQMMFVPQAICKTVVPDEFKVLLSQRRRWINSTVHNLMELVLVSDLCGIACLSMQFSVLIDLIGTLVSATIVDHICFDINYYIFNTTPLGATMCGNHDDLFSCYCCCIWSSSMAIHWSFSFHSWSPRHSHSRDHAETNLHWLDDK